MALDYKNKVPIPEHTVRVPNGNGVYIQYTLSSYRNKKGQPTNRRVSIGKLDAESGLMIPNTRYYELFDKQPLSALPSVIRSQGTYAAFRGVAQKLGLEKIVRRVFGERADAILSVAHYMMCEGNVMYYLDDWQDEHLTYSKTRLNTAGLSKLFAEISETERLQFFNQWMKQKHEDEYLAYDVTSISSIFSPMGRKCRQIWPVLVPMRNI